MQTLKQELERTQETYHSKYQAVLKEMLNDITK